MAYTKFSPDYYSVLGVRSTASPDEIRQAYRAQIRFFHPDSGNVSQEVANMKTRELNEAYEVLSDPSKKQLYDQDLRFYEMQQQRQQHGFDQEASYPPPKSGKKRSKPVQEEEYEDEEESSGGLSIRGLIWVAVIGVLLGVFMILLTSSSFSFSNLFSAAKDPSASSVTDTAALKYIESVLPDFLPEGMDYLGYETYKAGNEQTYYLFKIGILNLRDTYADANYGSPGPKYAYLQGLESDIVSIINTLPDTKMKYPVAVALYDGASFSEQTLDFYQFFTATDGVTHSGLRPAA